jgi:hypothetical protein
MWLFCSITIADSQGETMMVENKISGKSLLVAALAGVIVFATPAFSAGGQVSFALCKITLRGDGFKKVVGASKLTTTSAWYKAHGYEQTLKATQQQNLYPMLNSKFGKGNYQATCKKTI